MKTIEYYNHGFIKNKTKSLEELLNIIIESKRLNKEYNLFVTVINDPKVGKVNGPLSGVPYTLKDNFSTKDILSTGSSNMLKDYVPVYDSTVYKKLQEAGSILIGKTALDELGMGGTGTTAATGPVKNAVNKELISGGSSAGSAVSVALGLVPFSIGSDTGDSIRKPAAYNAIVGYKPSYGLISRYGLFPYASSLDTVGVLTNNVYDAALVVNEIKGKDVNDMTSVDSSNIDLTENIEKNNSKKLFYIKELINMASFSDVTDNNFLQDEMLEFSKTVSKLKDKGYTIEGVSIDLNLLKAIYPSYMVISCSEATSNYSNLNGIIFGPRGDGNSFESIMKNARGEGFCSLIKRRFVIGSYALEKENQEKYFLNAKRVRALIVEKINELFKEYDGLLMPVGNGYIPNIEEKYQIKDDAEIALDNILLIGNFGGYPSITLPVKKELNNFPFSINLTFNRLKDSQLLSAAKEIEEIINFKEEE